jgi:Holliday junction resolvase-like predicted endonuclease
MDEGHARVAGWIAAFLTSLGWEVVPEVSYAIRGERGSIDLLAWHSATRTMLVIEVKTELTSIEETLRRHDTKQRLAPLVAAERLGWRDPSAVCRLLVLPSGSTTRRHVARHGAVLDRAYRLRGSAARAWLAAPSGSASALIFAPLTRQARGKSGGVSRRRIRGAGTAS